MTVTASKIKFKVSGATVNLLDVLYPVGATYLTYENKNPGTFLGGTWALFSADRYLRGGASGAKVGGMGGSNTISVSQMPKHTHTMMKANWQDWASNDQGIKNRMCVSAGATAGTDGLSIVNNTGGGAAFYPSYTTVFAWRRTA